MLDHNVQRQCVAADGAGRNFLGEFGPLFAGGDALDAVFAVDVSPLVELLGAAAAAALADAEGAALGAAGAPPSTEAA